MRHPTHLLIAVLTGWGLAGEGAAVAEAATPPCGAHNLGLTKYHLVSPTISTPEFPQANAPAALNANLSSAPRRAHEP